MGDVVIEQIRPGVSARHTRIAFFDFAGTLSWSRARGRGSTLSSGIGEPQSGTDFGDGGARGKISV
jgi:hypothetical protein